MKTYVVRVNGIEYEVEVEERAQGASVSPAPAVKAAPRPAAPAPKATPAAPQQDGTPVTAGTAGKVWKIVKEVGDPVEAGEAIIILEAMKMEIPVVSPSAFSVQSILVKEAQEIKSGETVATVK